MPHIVRHVKTANYVHKYSHTIQQRLEREAVHFNLVSAKRDNPQVNTMKSEFTSKDIRKFHLGRQVLLFLSNVIFRIFISDDYI